jgi:acetylornithine deacetylase/succinyl-diaminopimelate desuccinylase-like protein
LQQFRAFLQQLEPANEVAMKAVDEFLTQHSARFLEELKTFLRIPSVSAVSAHQPDVRRAAEWVRDQLFSAGVKAELVETKGNPIVYGEWLNAPGAPTALVYGHYDVQPPDPLDEWKTPPFEPEVRDGKIYARGATDDKGQMFTHIKSVEAWLKSEKKLPINLKFVIEGEEEVGSDNLDRFLEERKQQLKCDVAVVSDTSQYAPGIPAITYGLRGIVACEVTLHGPKQDLHSGVFGGSVANPCNVLAKLLGKLHDDEGRIQVPGFYDDVIELSPEERKQWAALPFNEAEYLRELGSPAVFGEAGFSTLERRWARPTCDVNGLTGGYQGEGPKTIVPARASAKITCRLVPAQKNEKIIAALEKFLRDQCPPTVRFEFKTYHGCPATVCDIHSPFMTAAKAAVKQGFGAEPVLMREGGSIPVVGTFKAVLGVDTLLLGWGQNTDNLHSPNEHFSVDDFQRGIRASAALWAELAKRR